MSAVDRISQLEQRKEAIDKGSGRTAGDRDGHYTDRHSRAEDHRGYRPTKALRALRGETIAEDPETSARATKPTTPQRRKLSAQGLANIRAAVKRRWAMRRKATAAAKQAATKKVSAPAEKSGPSAKGGGE